MSEHTTAARPLYRLTQAIWYLLGLLELILLFRFFLKLFAANPNAGFTQFIYNISAPFAAPFLNVFRISEVNGSVFEWTTLLAMAVYWLIAWAIVGLLLMSRPISDKEAAEHLDEQHRSV